jgi:hypothetical protein
MLTPSSHSTTSSQITKGGKSSRRAWEKRAREILQVPQLAFVPLVSGSDVEPDIRLLSQANEWSSQKIEFVSPEIFLLWAQLYTHTMSLQTVGRVGPHQLTVCGSDTGDANRRR